MSKISMRQMEILNALARMGAPAEWGEVWDHVGWGDAPPSLQMINFDRAADALQRRGLVAMTEDNLVKLTEGGRSLLTLSSRA